MFSFKIRMVVQCTVVGAWVEGAVRNWFEEDEGGDGKRWVGSCFVWGEREECQWDIGRLKIILVWVEQENGKSVETKLEKGGRWGRRGKAGEISGNEENWSSDWPSRWLPWWSRWLRGKRSWEWILWPTGRWVYMFYKFQSPFLQGGKRGLLHALSEARCAGDWRDSLKRQSNCFLIPATK